MDEIEREEGGDQMGFKFVWGLEGFKKPEVVSVNPNTAKLLSGTADLIELVDYKESLRRLAKIIRNLKKEVLGKQNSLEFLPAWSFYLALLAQFKVLPLLNDKFLNCDVPWDKRTKLPSHPSVIADAERYARSLPIDLKTGGDQLIKRVLISTAEIEV